MYVKMSVYETMRTGTRLKGETDSAFDDISESNHWIKFTFVDGSPSLSCHALHHSGIDRWNINHKPWGCANEQEDDGRIGAESLMRNTSLIQVKSLKRNVHMTRRVKSRYLIL